MSAAPPARTGHPARLDDHVSRLGSAAAGAFEQLAVQHDAAADARSEGEEDTALILLPCAELRLAKRRGVRVVRHPHGNAQPLFKVGGKGLVLPAVIRPPHDDAVLPVDDAGRAHADGRKLRHGNARLRACAAHGLHRLFDGRGVPVLLRGRSGEFRQKVRTVVEQPDFDAHPPEVDPGITVHILPPFFQSSFFSRNCALFPVERRAASSFSTAAGERSRRRYSAQARSSSPVRLPRV